MALLSRPEGSQIIIVVQAASVQLESATYPSKTALPPPVNNSITFKVIKGRKWLQLNFDAASFPPVDEPVTIVEVDPDDPTKTVPIDSFSGFHIARAFQIVGT